jgi:hypothetical protein
MESTHHRFLFINTSFFFSLGGPGQAALFFSRVDRFKLLEMLWGDDWIPVCAGMTDG